MEFNNEDVFYILIKNRDEESVVRLQRDYEWTYETVEGIIPDLGTLFSNMDIDELVDSLRRDFDSVEIMDYDEL